MADAMKDMGLPPQARPGGELILAMYVPRAELGQVRRAGYRPDESVMLIVPAGNSADGRANLAAFEAQRSSGQRRALESATPEANGVARALERWRRGSPEGELGLPRPPVGDRLLIAAESPAPECWRLLTVGRGVAQKQATLDVICDTRVLVRGRVLELFWSREPATRVEDLALARERGGQWASTVIEANR
jgi:hypothetical protein